MKTKRYVCLFAVMIFVATMTACHTAPVPTSENKTETKVSVGAVRMNPHPATLAGKTVVLRWNGQCNGDTFLNSLAELLKHEVKRIKIVKMWEIDANTAVITNALPMSETIAGSIASQKPALVIAAQADSG
jgi:hypothetical protein